MLLQKNAPTLYTPQRAEEEARRARKIESIYHVGQVKAWDGRAVLQESLARFPVKDGEERIPRRTREALASVFSVLMWGELAAWRVSAQLADLMTDNEHRMAATSQAHDEARHYYVLHDYLKALNVEIPPLDDHSRAFLNACLSTRSVLNKVVGMQLFVETIALTIFKMVREMNVDPALSLVLAYYERDEARHVGFGVQALPQLVARAGFGGRVRLLMFEARVLTSMLRSLKAREADLRLVGVDPRTLLEDGGARFQRIVDDYRQEIGRKTNVEGQILARVYEAVLAAGFPTDPAASLWARAGAAASALRRPSPLS